MSLDLRRGRAIFRKELREVRHNQSLLVAMAVLPLVFIIQPLVAVLGLSAKAAAGLSHEHVLLYLAALVSLAIGGAGPLSVDGWRNRRS
jgi:ABC-2 type transport system permease protein